MAAVNSYRELIVWQRAMEVIVECYRISDGFPRKETYGLAAQLQRAAVSIASNIAEGAGRGHTREYIHHLFIARGSLFEVETQLLAAERLGYATKQAVDEILSMTTEIGKMLNGLIGSLERKLG